MFLRSEKNLRNLPKLLLNMPANKNALLRYKTIDKCLRNRARRWTLEDLVEACSDALYEYSGKDEYLSVRTIQLDIQRMRSDELGYNAPIVVRDRKYYTYEDPEYSISYLQPIITQYFIDNKSEIWLLFLIAHSKR